MKLRLSEKSLEVTQNKVLKIRDHKNGSLEIVDLQDAGHVFMQKMKRQRSLRDGFAYSTLILLAIAVFSFVLAGSFPIFYLVGLIIISVALLKHRYLDGKRTAKLVIQWKNSGKKYIVDLRDLPEEDIDYLFDLISSRF